TGIQTDLTTQDSFILNGSNASDYTITYHLSENGAKQGNESIPNPQNYANIQSPQTIWFRMIDNQNCVQYGSFILEYNLNQVVTDVDYENCSFTEFATYYLPTINNLVVTDVSGLDFSYHLTQIDAENEENPLPLEYPNTSPGQQIYVRVETQDGCFSIAKVTLTTIV